MEKDDVPKDEIRVAQKVCYPFEHAPRLEDEPVFPEHRRKVSLRPLGTMDG